MQSAILKSLGLGEAVYPVLVPAGSTVGISWSGKRVRPLSSAVVQRKPFIKTTSSMVGPRPKNNCLPSRDHVKAAIKSDVNLVSALGASPFSGYFRC